MRKAEKIYRKLKGNTRDILKNNGIEYKVIFETLSSTEIITTTILKDMEKLLNKDIEDVKFDYEIGVLNEEKMKLENAILTIIKKSIALNK